MNRGLSASADALDQAKRQVAARLVTRELMDAEGCVHLPATISANGTAFAAGYVAGLVGAEQIAPGRFRLAP